MSEEKEYLLLKWGTIKGYDILTERSKLALQKYFDAGDVLMSRALQEDNDAQKAALCELIDSIDGEIQNDWTGKIMTKEEAKSYVMNYGKGEGGLTRFIKRVT